jgi:glucarate dehydratase
MKITDIKPTTVAVPLEVPLRHANGCHWGRFVRTIVEVETDEGITGLGEMGGGGESAEATFRGMKSYLVGHDPARMEEMRFRIANPTASLYNNRTQILAALEFACLDILGKKWSVPVCDILGGRLKDRIPFASSLFFRYPGPDGRGEVRTLEQMVAHANELKAKYGFTSHKLKGGVFAPKVELEYYRRRREDALRERQHQGPRRPRSWRAARSRKARKIRGTLQKTRWLPLRPGPPCVPAGPPRSPTTAGPTRVTLVCRRSSSS